MARSPSPRGHRASGTKVTRRDVAERAGVSEAVVSYTLNRSAPVAPDTAARVMRAVHELGYRPNASARALSLGTSHTLGIVQSDSTNPHFVEYNRAIEEAARRAGYAAIVANSSAEDGDRGMDQVDWLARRQVDGLVLAFQVQAEDVTALDSFGIPWIAIDQFAGRGPANSIGIDLRDGARQVVGHLAEHGYRQIAIVGNTSDVGGGRLEGWRVAQEDRGLPLGPSVHAAGFDRPSGYAAGQELVKLDPLPDAVFACTDMLAIGVLRALHEAGLSVPASIALASFDGTLDAEYSSPALTTLVQPIPDMAEEAVRGLLASRPDGPRVFRQFTGKLQIRRSCGCAWP